jgi:hypothetical protein
MTADSEIRLRALRLDSGFEIAALLDDLAKVADDLWTPILTHRKLDWYGVALRSADGDPRTMRYAAECVDTGLMTTLSAMREVVASVPSQLRRVRLLALQPGAEIGVHTDGPGGATREARLHLPITTNTRAAMTIADEDIPMAPGELWWLNVDLPHSARNLGTEPRVHLVIDCVHDAWLDDRLH